MPIISSNKIITMHRGDSILIPIDLNIGTGVDPISYEMTEKDVLYFALLEPNQPWEEALIKRAFTYDDWILNHEQVIIHLSTEDSENLVPGTYYYQAKLYIDEDSTQNGQESVATVVPRTKVYILE